MVLQLLPVLETVGAVLVAVIGEEVVDKVVEAVIMMVEVGEVVEEVLMAVTKEEMMLDMVKFLQLHRLLTVGQVAVTHHL